MTATASGDGDGSGGLVVPRTSPVGDGMGSVVGVALRSGDGVAGGDGVGLGVGVGVG